MQYFVPGYLSILVFQMCSNKKISSNTLLILSCALSYISLSLISCVKQIDNVFIMSGISFIVLFIGALMLAWANTHKKFSELSAKFFRRTMHNSIWEDIVDFKNGTNLKVHLKNKDYCVVGHFSYVEESTKNPWLSISGYGIYTDDTNEPIEARYLNNEEMSMMVKMDDVDYIEIF